MPIGLVPLIALSHAKSPAVAYATFRFARAGFHSVTVDLSAGVAQLKTVHNRGLTSVWSLINQEQPVFAITGTFFGPKSQTPVADVLVDGELLARGNRGSGIGVGYDGTVRIFDARFKEAYDWGMCQYGLRGAVRVVSGGKVSPNPRAQAFKDAAIWGRAARTGLGLTKAGKLVAVATINKVSLSELGNAMRSRGVVNGISFDGGTSTCFYYNGAMLISPGRRLCNLLVVTLRP
jgi:hypothetical protein